MMFGYETALTELKLVKMNGLILFCVVVFATAVCTYGKIFYSIFHIISVNNSAFLFLLIVFRFFYMIKTNVDGSWL